MIDVPPLKMELTAERIAAAAAPLLPAGFAFRKMRPDDAPAYLNLMLDSGFDFWSDRYPAGVRNGALEGGVFFIEENRTGRLAATATANKPSEERPQEGELSWVAVHPDFRGRHFAGLVCQGVIDFYRRHGFTRLLLRTEDFRLTAIRIYLNRGWRPLIPDEAMARRWDDILQKLGR